MDPPLLSLSVSLSCVFVRRVFLPQKMVVATYTSYSIVYSFSFSFVLRRRHIHLTIPFLGDTLTPYSLSVCVWLWSEIQNKIGKDPLLSFQFITRLVFCLSSYIRMPMRIRLSVCLCLCVCELRRRRRFPSLCLSLSRALSLCLSLSQLSWGSLFCSFLIKSCGSQRES